MDRPETLMSEETLRREYNHIVDVNKKLLAACEAMYYSQGPIEEAAARDSARAAIAAAEGTT